MQETATPSPHRLLPNMNARPTEERGVKASQGHPLGEGPHEGHIGGGGQSLTMGRTHLAGFVLFGATVTEEGPKL